MRAFATSVGVAIAAIAIASCLVSRKSSDFECEKLTDCSDGRVCENGFCIRGELPPDAPPIFTCLTSLCIVRGGSCVGEVCTFSCSDPDCSDINCPANLACQIDCITNNSCQTTDIDCDDATLCTVNCTGDNSCARQVQCRTGACVVACSGAGSCDSGTDCDNACACDVTCTGLGACLIQADCPGGSQQCRSGQGCAVSAQCQNDCS